MIVEKRREPQYLLNDTVPTITPFDGGTLVMSDGNFGRCGRLMGNVSNPLFFFFFNIHAEP